MFFSVLSSQSIVNGCTGHFGSTLPFSSLLDSFFCGSWHWFRWSLKPEESAPFFPWECQDENPVVDETRRKREGIRRPVIKRLYLKRFSTEDLSWSSYLAEHYNMICNCAWATPVDSKAISEPEVPLGREPRIWRWVSFACKVSLFLVDLLHLIPSRPHFLVRLKKAWQVNILGFCLSLHHLQGKHHYH